jgi:hypothetical protein
MSATTVQPFGNSRAGSTSPGTGKLVALPTSALTLRQLKKELNGFC